MFQGDMDPELAALLGESAGDAGLPVDPLDLEADGGLGIEGDGAEEDLNLNEAGFPEITKKCEDKPHPAFSDPNYYKGAMSGEGNTAQRVHTVLQKYLNTKDPKDKGVFRQQLTTAYWDFLANVARKAPGKIPDSKKFLLRFNMLHPTFLTTEDRSFFAKMVVNNELNQPVYYLDEWFKAVGTGAIRNSATDEVKVGKNNNAQKFQQLLDKAMGKKDGARSLLKAKDEERNAMEHNLVDRIKDITGHGPVEGLGDVNDCYSDAQRKTIAEVQELLKTLLKTDHELDMYLKDYYQAETDVHTLNAKIEEEGGAAAVDMGAVDTEFGTVRQMVKMTVGRQGNSFPILSSEYFRSGPIDTGFGKTLLPCSQKSKASTRTHSAVPTKTVKTGLLPMWCWFPVMGTRAFAGNRSTALTEPRAGGALPFPCIRKIFLPPFCARWGICAGRSPRKRLPTTGWKKGSQATTTSGSRR